MLFIKVVPGKRLEFNHECAFPLQVYGINTQAASGANELFSGTEQMAVIRKY